MIRTFIAVEVTSEVKRRVADWIDLLRRHGVEARWVEPQNVHLTLQFLGNVRENLLPLVCQRVARAVGELPAFDVTCDELGGFPSLERPRVLWLGIGEGYQALVHLQGQVQEALRELGFRGETRQFEPHITLGRMRRAEPLSPTALAAVRQSQASRSPVSFDVSEVVVFSSQLTRQGPIYNVIGRAALSG